MPTDQPVRIARSRKTVTVTRACSAITVPYGERETLDAGSEVEIVQQLGSSVTVKNEFGVLLRLDGADLDAIGLDPIAPTADGAASDADAEFDMARVMDALDGVYDPEIPVSIVELGLVYRCEEVIDPDGRRRIEIDMTMTAPGCGMGDVLRDDAMRSVSAVPGVDEVEVELVWKPRWTVHHMSDATRLQLGLL